MLADSLPISWDFLLFSSFLQLKKRRKSNLIRKVLRPTLGCGKEV